MASKNQVWRSVDPLTEWKSGFVGLVHRTIAIVVQVAAETGLTAFLWKKYGWVAALAALVCCLPMTFFVILERRYWIRELITGVDFHKVAHYMRDEVASMRKMILQVDQGQYVYAYEQLHGKLCNHIARYFQGATKDPTVNCAIRLAVDEGAGVGYKTVGRSIGMDDQRAARSLPIPVNQGLARTLMDNHHLGVCHIVDIEEAIRMGWWMRCPSDLFPDVKVVMAAPINWYDESGKKSMGGILYVTSRRDNLAARHVEPLKGFADLLGFVYPAVTGKPQIQE